MDTEFEVGDASGDATIRLDGLVPSITVVDDRGDVAVRITTQPFSGSASTSAGPFLAAMDSRQLGDIQGQLPSGQHLLESTVGPKVIPRVDINGINGSIALAGLVEETAPVGPNDALPSGPVTRKVKVRLALDGENGAIEAGGNDVIGDLRLLDESGEQNVHIRGNGEATLGGRGTRGRLGLKRASGAETIRLDAQSGNIELGGKDTDGDLKVYGSDGKLRIRLSGDYGDLRVFASDGSVRIHLKGDEGDIILSNADFAEDFAVAEPIAPGTVVVLDAGGNLRPCTSPYDRAVAGVIAGAGGCRPAIIADRKRHAIGRQPVSLLGKAFCRTEADSSPIRVGDLLTTSAVAGHAMKASRPARAVGALLGKALAPLASGRGLIPILVLVR